MPDWWVPYVNEFVNRVRYLGNWAEFTVSSFGRTKTHNREVGGASSSQHLIWTAADLVPYDGDMAGLAELARETGAFGYVLNEGDHVHVQLFTASSVPAWVFDQVAVETTA
jgi:hypothetical protein